MKTGQGHAPPDSMKNDFQNARKRNLHSWAEWRTLVNDQLVDAMRTGEPLPDAIIPLETYMCGNQRVKHPTQNPKTLLTYSASEDTSTNLRRKHFISYGIPRAHLDPKQEGMSVLNSRLKASGSQLGYVETTLERRPSRKNKERDYDYRERRSPSPRQQHRSMWDLSSGVEEPEFDPSPRTVARSKSKKGKLPRTNVGNRLPRQGYQ